MTSPPHNSLSTLQPQAAAAPAGGGQAGESGPDPILCGHCGRTATNGISCQGMCVADSGY